MIRLQLPKNKFARLGINIAFIVIWIFLTFSNRSIGAGILALIFHTGYDLFVFKCFDSGFDFCNWLLAPYDFFFYLIKYLVSLMPLFLISRYIWFGRILPRPKITRSKD